MKIENVAIGGLNESFVASGLAFEMDYSSEKFKRQVEDCLCSQGNHKKRAKSLSSCAIGEGHDNFLCGIGVQANITAPRYWWPEFQRYHFVEIISSTSTMHSLKKIVDAFLQTKELFGYEQEKFSELADKYFSRKTSDEVIKLFLDECLKNNFTIEEMKANLPEGFLQTARISTNYRQLKTIYRQRKNHPLEEWQKFCSWIRGLPSAYLIVGEDK